MNEKPRYFYFLQEIKIQIASIGGIFDVKMIPPTYSLKPILRVF